MITMINKNGDQSVSLRNRQSYYEGFEINNFPKGKKKCKTGDTHTDELSALLKKLYGKQSSLAMMVVITLRQKFRVFRI